MARLIAALLRHADYRQLAGTPSAHQPFPLTVKGREQARAAASTLERDARRHAWQIAGDIDSSRLLRAWETASVIGERLEGQYSVSEHAALAERCVGSAANLTLAEIETIIDDDPRYAALPADWKSDSHFRLPLQGAESLIEAGERVAGHLQAAMHRLGDRADVDTVKIFVGHGAALRHAAHVLGILRFEQIAQLSMYHARPVYIEYGESGWRQVAGEWKVREHIVEPD